MRLTHILLVFLIIHLTACGDKTAREQAPVHTFSTNDELLAQVERISKEARYCDNSLAREGTNGATNRADCNTGDSMLWSGLSYFAWPRASVAEAIEASLAEDGRPFRSPEHKKGNDAVDSFSRDMWLGFMAYCLKSSRWDKCNAVWDYTRGHDYQACPAASDNRCKLTPSVLYLTGYIWGHNNWYIHPEARPGQLERYADEQSTIASALDVPHGYQLNLVAVRTYLIFHAGKLTSAYKDAMDKVYSREPDDLFYRLVYAQMHGDEALKNDIAAKLLTLMKSWNRPVGFSQWVWGDTIDHSTGASRYHEAMGHDFVFLACNIVECK